MFIVIKNENSNIINNLSINVTKTLVGEFTRKDLDNELYMVNYERVIVDVTSIKNYYDDNYLYSFLQYFNDPSKIIILLNDSFVANSKLFLSNLIKHGYYNFATSDSSLNKLIERENTLEDVKDLAEGYDFLKSDTIVSGRTTTGFETDKYIIGIENGIPHSGATTLMYMLVKELSKKYNVKGVEMNKEDSLLFNDDRVISCESKSQLETIIMSLKDIDVFVIDLNGSDVKQICTKIIYLIETGTIKVNKLMKGEKINYEKLIGTNIVLNRTNLTGNEVKTFEYETGLNVVASIGNLNERQDSNEGLKELVKFLDVHVKGTKKGFWNIFK